MYTFLPYVAALVIILLVHSIWKRSRNPFGLPQARFNWPFIIQFLVLHTKRQVRFQEEIAEHRKKYGDLFVMPMFGNNLVVMGGEEAVTWANKQEKDDNLLRTFVTNIEILLGDKNIVDNKAYWKHNRATLSPILMKSSTLNNFAPIMESTFHEHLSKIKSIDAVTLAPLVFDVAWLFIVGKRGVLYKQQIAEYYKAIKNGFFGIPYDLPFTALRKGLHARAEIRNIVQKILDADPSAKTDPECCLSSIITNYPDRFELSVLGLLFASHETLYSSLSGLIWCLIQNPDVLEKLKHEIRSSEIHPVTITDFHSFPYLNKVINEVLRLFGVDFITRTMKSDTPFKNHVFPKGTQIMVYAGYDHLDVSNSAVFNPDREEKYRWEPFGTGPRSCLGKAFALFEMKSFVYYLLKNYDVKPEKEANAAIYNKLSVILQNARLNIIQPSTQG